MMGFEQQGRCNGATVQAVLAAGNPIITKGTKSKR
jgi:hypothetical protein